jgi:hypothetical protein
VVVVGQRKACKSEAHMGAVGLVVG